MKTIPFRSEAVATCLKALQGYADATRVRASSGHVLVYPGHYAGGVFLLLAGALKLQAEDDAPSPSPSLFAAGRGVFYFPGLSELDRPCSWGVKAEEDSELLFVPRSLAMHDPGVRRCLQNANLTALSLR